LPHHPPRRRAQVVRRELGDAGRAVAAELDALDLARYAAAPGQRHKVDRSWWQRFTMAVAAVGAAKALQRR
jgi:hypothetical protein